ncbi:MAG: NAD(P)/FAD-dependent oxidoreductase [Spirochaetota bacterium]|nr:NAD(P)/FAD-dependent oxidoreductase [Spirochaetota bacterium]
MYDVAIIGAGVTGAAIARELSRYKIKIIILEKETDVSCGTSKANSAIIHAGYDAEEDTFMAKFNTEGNPMFDTICNELSVPFKRIGSLVVAFDNKQLNHLNLLFQRGINNGIKGMKILSEDELKFKEPNISKDAKGALFAPTAGIIDPMLLTISLIESAVINNAEYSLNFEVKKIIKQENIFKISGEKETIEAKWVINAAGVNADKIHNMVSKLKFEIIPRRGQYFLLDKTEGEIVNSIIFPCPTEMGKGTLITPTVHGNLILGPSSDNLEDPEDLSTTEEMLNLARSGAKKLIPNVNTGKSIRNFAGMRAVSNTGDFIIEEADDTAHFIDVSGIKSPGLTAAPAIAVYVIEMLKNKGLKLINKKNFNPVVKRKIFMDLSFKEQEELIKNNPLYGRIICRCENITEGDILDSIHRPLGARTVDGVKRRCRPGMGRCQGGFCSPLVQNILARELNIPIENIILEKKHSYILTGRTK